MHSKMKTFFATVILASLSGGVSYALEAGNVVYAPVNSSCVPSPTTGFPWAAGTSYNVPIIMGGTENSDTDTYYLFLTSPQDPCPSNNCSGTLPAWTWVYILNFENDTYTLEGPGISGSGTVTGSFSGSLSASGGLYTLNLTMSCGATIKGAAYILGS